MWVSHNPFKQAFDYAPKDDRVEMCKIATQQYPWLRVTSMEEDFHDTKTASSLTLLKEMFPQTEFIWVFGDDNFASFHDWNDERFMVNDRIVPDWQYILHEFSVAVIHRPGYRELALNSPAASYNPDIHVKNPFDLAVKQKGWTIIDNETLPYSSTSIKEAIARRETAIPGLHPEVEKIIYDRDLFGAKKQFNTSALPHEINNHVRFQTFSLLANTVNLVKSISTTADVNGDLMSYTGHFSKSWKKSVAKDDFKKYEDIPGEIADCLISLYWIASHVGYDLKDVKRGNETQSSVSQWCDDHYPQRALEDKLMDYIEELAELCVCEGLEKHRAINIISEILRADDFADPNHTIESNFKNLHAYAKDIGQSLNDILDKKMSMNRERTQQQSATRESIKRDLMTRQPL